MAPKIKEEAFEDAIEHALLRSGPDARPESAGGELREDAAAYGSDAAPGGYLKRTCRDYDPDLCLLPGDVVDFVLATQPKEWKKLAAHHGEEVKARFMHRLAQEIQRRGTLDVLRRGLKDSGVRFQLAYFRPASGMNEETARLHGANLFAVVRQLHYRPTSPSGDAEEARGRCIGPSLDLALFLNGIPVFTAELKNPLNGQDVQDAIRQYRRDRGPREPLFAYGRCLAHFAVDPDLVFVTTHLRGKHTRFLPFNKGRYGGAGNPPVPPTQPGYATDYLWERIWTRDSVLDLVRQFISEIEEEGEGKRRSRKRHLVFPRYQQLDCVRRLVAAARGRGSGARYLIQHSAGSGKSYTIAWLAHQLSTLHDAEDRRVFDSIIVVTDRRVLDRQLQRTIRSLEQSLGVVENIDQTSRQLREALEGGKTIIVTTLQKFPVIVDQIGELAGQRFAVIVDEAHSSQSGESTKSLKSVLSTADLDEAEAADAGGVDPVDEVEARVLREIEARGPRPNLSTFAFTATPKPKTLELFGVKQPDGRFAPFHLYSMRQAIEEGFILDVLANYTTYKAYWRLLKTVEGDPRYEKRKAEAMLKAFVELSPHAIQEKIAIIVQHFGAQVASTVGGKAKAMIVTRSRLHAVRTKLALDAYLRAEGFDWKCLVAFSGTVQDGGATYTETGMNSEGEDRQIAETRTAQEFQRPEYRFLVVANKFQTGFDEPLLAAMYVDKKLGGVGAVQTLSRLNRTHPDKSATFVLDFANEASEIKDAFEPYYEATLLSEETDPNLLYEVQGRLEDFGVFEEADVEAFAKVYFDAKATQDRLYSVLDPPRTRFGELDAEEAREFRSQLGEYVRLYAFLSQVLTFAQPDTDLEKLYQFARYFRRLLPTDEDALPREVQQAIDMESYRIQRTSRGRISLEREAGQLDPVGSKPRTTPTDDELEPLSRIISALNDRFGLNLGPEHRVALEHIREALEDDAGLDASARVNDREAVRLTFDPKLEDKIQDIVETHFDLYKRITDDEAFGATLKNLLFDDYMRRHRRTDELLKLEPSQSLDFVAGLETENDRFTFTRTIASFMNARGGDLILGAGRDRTVVGIGSGSSDGGEPFVRDVRDLVRASLGDSAATLIDVRVDRVDNRSVALVSCRRSPKPVLHLSETPPGLWIRTGRKSERLDGEDREDFVQRRSGSRD